MCLFESLTTDQSHSAQTEDPSHSLYFTTAGTPLSGDSPESPDSNPGLQKTVPQVTFVESSKANSVTVQNEKKPVLSKTDVKLSINPYLNFYKGLFHKVIYKGMSASEVAKVAGRLWSQMSESDKRPYYLMAERAKANELRRSRSRVKDETKRSSYRLRLKKRSASGVDSLSSSREESVTTKKEKSKKRKKNESEKTKKKSSR